MSKNNKKWTHVNVEYIDEDEFPKNIYEVESPRQLERWLKDVILDAYNESTAKAVGRIVSMVERNKDESLSVAREVGDYIMTTTGGWFSLNDICRQLQLTTAKDRKNVVVCLVREKEKALIESHPTRNGLYRRIMSEIEPIDWRNAPANPLPLKWPLGLESLVDIYCGNTIVVAGDANVGKSSFAFNFIEMNMDKWEIDYYSSEMGDSELGLRLSKFPDVKQWKFNAYERSANWADVVKPDNISVIDFLEILDEFWQVGKIISNIHQKLVNGIALIMIQKSPGAGLGRGASFGTEKPRLYLTLESGKAKIVKAKNWAGIENPNGLITDFSIIQGAKMTQKGLWHHEGDDLCDKKGRY